MRVRACVRVPPWADTSAAAAAARAGTSLDNALQLRAALREHGFSEAQVFLVDHYLTKASVQVRVRAATACCAPRLC